MDIEVIIDYIQKQGCNVRVMKGYLVLWKEAKGTIAQLAWYISDIELTEAYPQTLFITADRKIAALDHHIATTEPAPEELYETA